MLKSNSKYLDQARKLVKSFLGLLENVVRHPTALRSSRIGIALNCPSGRHGSVDSDQKQLVESCRDRLQKLGNNELGDWEKAYILDSPPKALLSATSPSRVVRSTGCLASVLELDQSTLPGLPKLNDDASRLILLTLSCFRRTRTLVGLRAVLGPLVVSRDFSRQLPCYSGDSLAGPYAKVDRLLEVYSKQGWLSCVDGGLFWMKRPIPDSVYGCFSSHTTTDVVLKLFAGILGSHEWHEAAAQLVLLALNHDRIARQYYFETYHQSKHASAFLEYVYHRVSSIRYLTTLALALGGVALCQRLRGDFMTSGHKSILSSLL
jgi:hypothetical protein